MSPTLSVWDSDIDMRFWASCVCPSLALSCTGMDRLLPQVFIATASPAGNFTVARAGEGSLSGLMEMGLLDSHYGQAAGERQWCASSEHRTLRSLAERRALGALHARDHLFKA